jgi:hypothetical protein
VLSCVGPGHPDLSVDVGIEYNLSRRSSETTLANAEEEDMVGRKKLPQDTSYSVIAEYAFKKHLGHDFEVSFVT